MRNRRLIAYYFMGQDLCVVRRHLRADLEWMAGIGTDGVAIGCHEFQLDYGNQQQLDLLFAEAQRAGLEVHAIPSRWGGLVAGWPPAAGMFAATHPQTWILDAQGRPLRHTFCAGPLCSIYAPETQAFFLDAVDRLLNAWPIAGIVWDEIKVMHEEDHSPQALAACGGPARGAAHRRRVMEFFGAANRRARERRPDLTIACFVYAQLSDEILQACATMDGLDSFGIDGHCWPDPAPGAKTLFGNIGRAARACRTHDRRLLALVETQLHHAAGWAARTLEHLPAFLNEPVDDLFYYYHGASATDDAEDCMEQMKLQLQRWRAGGDMPSNEGSSR
jgi:hypothetical protein